MTLRGDGFSGGISKLCSTAALGAFFAHKGGEGRAGVLCCTAASAASVEVSDESSCVRKKDV